MPQSHLILYAMNLPAAERRGIKPQSRINTEIITTLKMFDYPFCRFFIISAFRLSTG
jgi:hypothetical protein